MESWQKINSWHGVSLIDGVVLFKNNSIADHPNVRRPDILNSVVAK